MRFPCLAAAIAVVVSVGLASASAAQERAQLLSYEAIPSAQLALDLGNADYAQRAEFTAAALEEIAPKAIAAAGFDPALVETEMTPGGYLLETNASLQARAVMTDAEATRLAAALGYVFRQWSVLVSELDDDTGDTAYVTVTFPESTLTPEAAQAFFAHAAAVDDGLGGGYTAFGDAMIFLNVRDGDGAPYSGLEDPTFAARLGFAAGTFPDAALSVAAAGVAEARFVGNDWTASPNGEDYAATLDDPRLLQALDAARAEHTQLVETMGAALGWR
ncbi:MAG: hypothetical protein AAFX81_15540 [Pseudomonadota bacterium]